MLEALNSYRVRLKRLGRRVGTGILVPVLLSSSALPQSIQPKPLIVQREWRAEDGLPTHDIRALVESRDHLLWIGETHGLFRFDGVTFTNIPLDTGVSGVAYDIGIDCLYALQDGRLLVGTEGDGLLVIRDGRVVRASAVPGERRAQVIRSIFRDGQGKIWIGADQGLFQFEGNLIKSVPLNDPDEPLFVRSIAEVPGGGLLVGGSRLVKIVDGRFENIPLPNTTEQEIVTGITADRFGDVWIGTFSGLFRLSGACLVSAEVRTPIVALLTDRNHHTVAALESGTIVTLNALRKWSALGLLQGIHNATVLTDDLQGNLWVGTDHSLVRAARTTIKQYDLPLHSSRQGVSLSLDSNGTLLADGELYYEAGHGFNAIPFPEAGAKVSTALRDRNGSLWIGTNGGGLFHSGDKGTEHHTIKEGMPNNFVKALMQSHDGAIWIATDGGVGKIDRLGIHSYDVSGGLAYFSVTSLFEDKSGDVWIGTSRGLSHMHHGQFVQDDTTRRLAAEVVLSIRQLSSGTLLVGTGSGLFALSSAGLHSISLSDGVTAATISNLLEDGQGQIWLTSLSGLACFREKDLEAAAVTGGKPSLVAFLSSEEIGYRNIASGPPPAAVLTPNHHLLVGTNADLLDIDINSINIGSPPTVQITAIRASNLAVFMTPSRDAKLGTNAQNIEIEFAAESIGPQDRFRYQYKMDGVDHEWSQPTTRRVAYYTTLPPGKHLFSVRVRETGVEGSNDSGLMIDQSPKFYQTWLFRGSILLVACLFVAAIIWVRSRQIRLRYAAVLQERTRVAREMHDTLIQGCTSTSAFLEAYELATQRSGHAQTGRAGDFLNRAREQLGRTITEARAAVWNLRIEDSTSRSLASVLRETVERMRRPGVRVEFATDDDNVTLSREQVFELAMISREAVNNALEHSQASRVLISMTTTQEHLLLRISDNGRGFDHEVAEGGRNGHYGITGMKERAARLSGAVRLEGGPGRGTVVIVIIPM